MRVRKFNQILIVTGIIFNILLINNLSTAYMVKTNNEENNSGDLFNSENIVSFNETTPTIDGDLDSYEGEWDNATVYTNTIFDNIVEGNIEYTTRVKVNSSHIFMAISYETIEYVPINTTIPDDQSYNNQSHSWLTIIFDRNFDNNLGTTLSPDDAIVLNYRNKGVNDAFINNTDGTDPQCLVLDESNGGINNTVGALKTETNYIGEYTVTIEIAKELSSNDNKGYDINLSPSQAIPFALVPYQNYTAEFNISIIDELQWNNLRLEPLHEVFSYVENLEDLQVVTYVTDGKNSELEDYYAIGNLLSAYGIDSRVRQTDEYEITSTNLESLDLFILAGSQRSLSREESQILKNYLASGGNILVLTNQISKSNNLNVFLRNYGMEIYNSSLYSTDKTVNSSIVIDSSKLSTYEYLTENTSLTTKTVANILYSGSAINYTRKTGEEIFASQKGDLYPILSSQDEYFINLGEQGLFNQTEDINLNNTIMQSAIELRYGGKMIVSASSDMYNSTNIIKEDNNILLLRQIQWLLNLQYRLNYDNYNVLDKEINEKESIGLNISVTGDNDTIVENLTVTARILVLKEINNEKNLTVNENGIDFNGTLEPKTKAAWVEVEIVIHKRGYGYNYTDLFQVYINKKIETPIQLSYIVLIIFFASIGLATIGAIAIRKYEDKEEIENTEK